MAYVRFSGLISNRLLDHGIQPLPGMEAVAEIPSALAALVASAKLSGSDLYVTLADHLVRHFVFERPVGARSPRELELAAGLRFEDVFASPMANWQIQVDLKPRKKRLIACAAQRPLLDGLIGACREGSIRLKSIQPLSFRELAKFPTTTARGPAIYAVAGPRNLWLGRTNGREWQSSQSHPIAGSLAATFDRLMKQEQLRMHEGEHQPTVWAGGYLLDTSVRQELEQKSVRITGAQDWPDQNPDWAGRYRIALSPVWPCR